MRNLVESLDRFQPAMFQRPELGGERARRRLQQARQVKMIGAETHAEFAQRGAAFLRQALHFLGDPGALEHAERLARSGRRRRARCPRGPRRFQARPAAPSSFLTCWASHRSRRCCTMSSEAPVSCSSASTRTRGLRTWSPAAILPTGSPSQRIDSVIGEDEGFVDGFVHARPRGRRTRWPAPFARRRSESWRLRPPPSDRA